MQVGLQIRGMARMQLNDYKRYLRRMEEAIAARNAEIQAGIELDTAGLEPPDPEYYVIRESWNPDRLDYSSKFPQFLHEGFFLSCWSWFESYIQTACIYIDKHLEMPSGWDTGRQSILNKSRSYFKKIDLANILRHPTWYEINHYSQIRNTILHNRGYFIGKSDRSEAFVDYLVRKNIVPEKLSPGVIAIIRHSKGQKEANKRRVSEMKKLPVQIILTAHFCSEIIETYQDFFGIVGDESDKLVK